MQAGLRASGAGRREICCMTAPGTAGRRPRGEERGRFIPTSFPIPLSLIARSIPACWPLAGAGGREGGREGGRMANSAAGGREGSCRQLAVCGGS